MTSPTQPIEHRSAPLVLGLAASPRPGGNTRRLLDWFLEGALDAGAETDTVVLNDLSFRPCQACGGCHRTGRCVLDDDLQAVYDQVRSARALVLASPIHFGSLAAQAKMAIDRFQCFWAAKYLLERPWIDRAERRQGVLLAVGGMKRGEKFIRNAEEVAKVLFTVLNLEHAATLFYPDVDEPGAIAHDPRFRDEARAGGRALVGRLLTAEEGPVAPPPEEPRARPTG